MNPIRKYPRTQHLVGSGLQPGDEDLDAVPMSDLKGKRVVGKKTDGANCGVRGRSRVVNTLRVPTTYRSPVGMMPAPSTIRMTVRSGARVRWTTPFGTTKP